MDIIYNSILLLTIEITIQLRIPKLIKKMATED